MSDLIFDQAETAARLRESMRIIKWATDLVPPAWTHENPSYYAADAWSVTMNLAHLTVYEEQIANPLLAALSAGNDGVAAVKSTMEHWILAASGALAKEDLATVLARFRKAREVHVELVERFPGAQWNVAVTPLFSTGFHGPSPHSPAWVANKTFQHTWEHGNAILRMGLFAPR